MEEFPDCVDLISFGVLLAQSTASCLPNKPEPIAFDCPNCGAKYIIVTMDVANSVPRSNLACARCGAVSLEYILLDGDANE